MCQLGLIFLLGLGKNKNNFADFSLGFSFLSLFSHFFLRSDSHVIGFWQDIPLDYEEDLASYTVCQLKKVLYGLKQLLWALSKKFVRGIMVMGYK